MVFTEKAIADVSENKSDAKITRAQYDKPKEDSDEDFLVSCTQTFATGKVTIPPYADNPHPVPYSASYAYIINTILGCANKTPRIE